MPSSRCSSQRSICKQSYHVLNALHLSGKYKDRFRSRTLEHFLREAKEISSQKDYSTHPFYWAKGFIALLVITTWTIIAFRVCIVFFNAPNIKITNTIVQTPYCVLTQCSSAILLVPIKLPNYFCVSMTQIYMMASTLFPGSAICIFFALS